MARPAAAPPPQRVRDSGMLEDQLRLQGQTHSGFSSSLPTFIAKINRCIPGGVKVGANSRAHNVSGLASSLSREIIEPRICHNIEAYLAAPQVACLTAPGPGTSDPASFDIGISSPRQRAAPSSTSSCATKYPARHGHGCIRLSSCSQLRVKFVSHCSSSSLIQRFSFDTSCHGKLRVCDLTACTP